MEHKLGSCAMLAPLQDVLKIEVDSAVNAKRRLWEAHGRRTVFLEKDGDAVPSHACDFVVTFYWIASHSTREDLSQRPNKSKCAKVVCTNWLLQSCLYIQYQI